MADAYDLIIIGAGPAGITASVYAARKRMNFLVISKDVGGQTAWTGDIENYTGYQFISGMDLTAKFQEHMKKYNVKLKQNEQIIELKKQDNIINIKTDKTQYQAKAVIIATGGKSRELNIPGEKEFKNKGLTYCATCDGPLFAGKDVAVVGAGNAGLEAVLQLMNIAKHIYLIEVGPKLNGDSIMQEKIKKSEKVTLLLNAKAKQVLGDKMVNAIKIETNDGEKTISLQGVFVEIGLVPNTEFAKGLDLKRNTRGEIEIDCRNSTNIPGVFAAGDVTNVPEKQIVIAAGEGAKALLSAFRYLGQQK
ncbi:MAG: FAD-dependent oxidoreductase [Candidatus Omnitrophota bacterium]